MNSGEEIKDRAELMRILDHGGGAWNYRKMPYYRVPLQPPFARAADFDAGILATYDARYVEFRHETGLFEGRRAHRIVANGVTVREWIDN